MNGKVKMDLNDYLQLRDSNENLKKALDDKEKQFEENPLYNLGRKIHLECSKLAIKTENKNIFSDLTPRGLENVLLDCPMNVTLSPNAVNGRAYLVVTFDMENMKGC